MPSVYLMIFLCVVGPTISNNNILLRICFVHFLICIHPVISGDITTVIIFPQGTDGIKFHTSMRNSQYK
uniref:Secreted protein n=1 Tax=Arundo donax TaxID=35708 RepID=A0A0A9HT50_ARUDO